MSSESEYRWELVTGAAAFAARDGAGALVFDRRMWLLGGWNPGDKINFPRVCNSEVWSSVDGAHWERVVDSAPWEGRHTAGYAVHDGAMWIVGGDCNQGHYQNDVWASRDGIQWREVTRAVPWAPRALHYTVSFDSRLWIMGGQTLPQFAESSTIFYNDIWSSADGERWDLVTDHAQWRPRGMIGGSAVFAGKMWILGGGTYDTPEYPDRLFYHDVWCSSDGCTWKEVLPEAPWHPRQYHDVAVFDGALWVAEGWNRGNRNDVWYSRNGTDWHELPDTPWAPRHASSLFVFDDALWVVAGNNMESDVWKLVRERSARKSTGAQE